jgi:hypothetical protein
MRSDDRRTETRERARQAMREAYRDEAVRRFTAERAEPDQPAS